MTSQHYFCPLHELPFTYLNTRTHSLMCALCKQDQYRRGVVECIELSKEVTGAVRDKQAQVKSGLREVEKTFLECDRLLSNKKNDPKILKDDSISKNRLIR